VGLACTVVATIATAPVMLLVFGELSLIGLVANALVLPLVGIAVWSGALSAAFTPIAPVVAGWLAQPGGIAAGLTLEIASWSERRAYAVVGWEGALAVVVAIALVLVIRPPKVIVGAIVAGAALTLAFSVPRPPSEPRLLVIDIGQGNASLLQDGTEGVLVDAGPVDGGVVAALRRSGIRRLRSVILSHPAADHDGGAASAIDAFPTDLVIDGGTPGGGPTHDAAIRAARRRGTRVVQARVGQQLSFGRIALRLRWPTARASAAPGDPNDRAAVVEAQIGTLRALLPADAEGNVLTTLPNLKADVLVVSHHGSNDDRLPAVLRRLRPRLAVISLGTPNTYGHPTPATLGALRDARVPTLRTDQDGTIDVRAGADGQLAVRRVASSRGT
jgi:competence protein ComEC